MSKTKRLVISLPPEQYQFVIDSSKGNQSYVVNEAIKAYRDILELLGSEWKEQLPKAANALELQLHDIHLNSQDWID